MNTEMEQTAARWSRPPDGTRMHWWQHPLVRKHINQVACGEPTDGLADADVAILKRRGPFSRAVSVGAGVGIKELALLGAGAVEHFAVYELSESRVEDGRRRAALLGLTDRIEWHTSSPDFGAATAEFDLVYWNNALHHMLDTPAAIGWSRNSLRGGGTFFMNDYVGPNRMQWSDDEVAIARSVRLALPESVCSSAEVHRMDPAVLAREDPSECADSERILPSLRATFPDVEITFTGGLIYHVALRDALDKIPDRMLVPLLVLDTMYAERGLGHYAVAVAESPEADSNR